MTDKRFEVNINCIHLIRGSTRLRVVVHRLSPFFPEFKDVVLRLKLTDYAQLPPNYAWQVQYRYYWYNKSDSEIVVPINYLQTVEQELSVMGAHYDEFDEPLVKGRNIKIKMIDGFEPREGQGEVIDHMAQEHPFRKGVSTSTGSGKTVSSIAAVVKRGKAAMIIASGLTDQWVDQFRAFTNVGNRIVLIQGIQSLMDVIQAEEKPDIFVFSLETLRRYVNRESNYQDLPTFEQFIDYFGIDTKITDEVHLNFWTGTMVDLHSNIKNNIYLTATFKSSNIQTRRIFNTIFPPAMRFGENDRERYIRFISYGYRMFIPDRCYMSPMGYNHNGVERYLIKRPQKLNQFFEEFLSPVINANYDNVCKPGQKCLIYFYKIDMINKAKTWLQKAYPNRKVGVYIGGSEERAYDKYEIIVTNLKKAGTGTDIKNLYVLINTVSFRSAPLAEQLPGRLRKLPDGTNPVFIEMVNLCIRPQVFQRKERLFIHQKIALTYEQRVIS